MAWTQSDLDRIEAAIAGGTRRVKFQSHEVEYQSIGDMLKARDAIKAEINADSRPGVSFADYRGGY
jgi:hypothetical protein